jgi:hypothetical protein
VPIPGPEIPPAGASVNPKQSPTTSEATPRSPVTTVLRSLERQKRAGCRAGGPSKRQATAWRHLKHWQQAVASDELPKPKLVLDGRALKSLYEKGRPYAYRVPRIRELSATSGDRTLLTPRDWLALEVILAAQLLYRMQALRGRHEDLAQILGCHKNTVATTLQKLVDLGLVAYAPIHVTEKISVQLGTYTEDKSQPTTVVLHERCANVYWISERVMALLGVRTRPAHRPPPAPGVAGIAIVDQLLRSRGVDQRNCDPRGLPVLSADQDLPGESEREAPASGAPAAPPAAESIITVPDAAPAHGSDAVGVKAQPASSPEAGEQRVADSGPTSSPLLARFSNRGDLELFKMRIEKHADRKLRDHLRALDAAFARKAEQLEQRRIELQQAIGTYVRDRGFGTAPTMNAGGLVEITEGLTLSPDEVARAEQLFGAQVALRETFEDAGAVLTAAATVEAAIAITDEDRNVAGVDDRELDEVLADAWKAFDRHERGGDS